MLPVRSFLEWARRNGKRAGITVLGFTLVLGGLALLVLPGPGILVVLAGFAVLATEYAWAARALDETKRRTRRASKKVRRRLGRRG